MAWKKTLLYYKQSPYQRIAFFTEADGSYSMTLDDFWQFNSRNEHIYHECLFTLPAVMPKKLESVLILGGGDGLGVKRLLQFPTIKRIDLVDLDPEVIRFARSNFIMNGLNHSSLHDPRVHITVQDAKAWLAKAVHRTYDLIIVDFPDPTTELLWDLYTEKLYGRVRERLNEGGVVAIQGSTYNTKEYEVIFQTLDKIFSHIIGYHTDASSIFCGFFICSNQPIKMYRNIPSGSTWLTPKRVNRLLSLPVIPENGKRC